MRLVAERPGGIRWTHVHLLAERDEAGLYAARLASYEKVLARA